MFAVVEIGGRQYKVSPGDSILSESLDGAPGSTLTFPRVLLLHDEGDPQIGMPFVSGVEVQAKVLEHGKGEKVITVKQIPKKRYMRVKGHRQPYTKLQIVHIGPVGSTPPPVMPESTKAAETPAKPKKTLRAGASKTVKGTPEKKEMKLSEAAS